MKLKVFTLRLDPAAGAFDDRALTEFLESRDVLSVQEQFFVHETVPTWALLVCYRDLVRPGDKERAAESRTDWRGELAEDEQALFDALRTWRNERAKREGRPPYVLFTNRQMAEIARRRPASAAALREIQGIGDAKVSDWGDEVLGLVSAGVRSSSEAAAREEAGGGA